MPAESPRQPKPIDCLLRALCCGALFVGFGFLNHPHGFWGKIARDPTQSANERVVIEMATFAVVAWLLGSAVETGLVALGVRITRPVDQTEDYDDLPGG